MNAGGSAARLQVRGSADRARTLYFIAAAVLAALVPIILFAGLWLRALLNQSERDLEAHLSTRAASLSSRVDAEIAQQLSMLQAIGSLLQPGSPDLSAFRANAAQMVSSIPQWSVIVLIDPITGQHLARTDRPPGPSPSDLAASDPIRRVAERRRPAMFTHYTEPSPYPPNTVLLAVPIVHNEAVPYVLVAAMKAEIVQSILMQVQETGLLNVIVDEQDRVLARSRGVDQFLGREANEPLRTATGGRKSGRFVAETLDGQNVFTVYERSPLTGWLAIAATDRQQYDVLTERSTWTLVGTGAISLALAGVLAAFLFYNVLERRVTDERLAASRALGELDARLLTTTQEALSEQRKSASEREVLLREIYHRVKNNLQIIQSLLQLGSRNLQPEQREPFEGAIRRIGAMARVHSLLYKSPDLASIDFKDYLEDLVKETAEGFGADMRGVRTELDAQSMRIPLDTAVPLAFITVELLTNAFKHAFPGGRSGTITIAARKEGETGILTVADNGIGIRAEEGSKRSLGLTLVRKLIEQIAGTLEAPAQGSSSYRVTFPLTPPHQATVLPPTSSS